MIRLSRLAKLAACSVLLVQLVGCSTAMMSPPGPTQANVLKLRGAGLAPAALGTFALDASKPAHMDKSMSVRAAGVASPVEGSFAQYLKQSLKVELDSAGLLDPASDAVIMGTLTESELDPAMSTATGSLAARFVVKRAGAERYNRVLRVDDSWESSFIGATAIPLAAGRYEGLYRKLVSALVDDAAFRNALKK